MLSKFILKRAAIFTLFFFVGLCLSSSLAVANENTSAPASEKSQGESTGIEKTETGPGVTEVESPDSAKTVLKAKKKFPWLLVGAGVVVAGVLIYLLLGKKKEQTLTVSLGAGATGTPAVTAKYKKDTAVSYSYTPQAGYGSLLVKLDGVAVAASGSVNMDKDHTLDVSASQQYTLTVSLGAGTTGTPAATTSYNKDQVVNYSYSLQSGYVNLLVKLDGNQVAASGAVTMNSNHSLTVSATKIYGNGVLTINGVRYDLVSIPSGEFQMGSNNGDNDEKPVHTVRISRGFWLGKTEVTQGLWQAVMGSNPSGFKKGATYPVEEVSWDDCQAFITKLNQLAGGNIFRMPTEAEWEYGCRAGTTGDHYGNFDAIAWNMDNSGNSTHPVGQKQPNAFGLYDMLGNVWEWCQDWAGYYSSGYQTDPTGPTSGSKRIFRGGCWFSTAQDGRSANRASAYTWENGGGQSNLGFRLAAVSAGN